MHLFKNTLTVAVIGSPDLYNAVRAGFINQGTSLNAWCIAKGINRQTAEKALKGISTSRQSLSLTDTLVDAALPKRDRR
jgi:hypothetical protein